MGIKTLIGALVSGENLSEAFRKSGLEARGIYGHIVSMQEDIINSFHSYRTDDLAQKQSRSAIITPKMEALMALMNQHFTGYIKVDEGSKAYQQVKALFHSRDYVDTLNEDKLKSILMIVVPVAVMRNLLARHKVSFNPSGTPSWDPFVTAYCDCILAA
jgi:hypothetical protein